MLSFVVFFFSLQIFVKIPESLCIFRVSELSCILTFGVCAFQMMEQVWQEVKNWRNSDPRLDWITDTWNCQQNISGGRACSLHTCVTQCFPKERRRTNVKLKTRLNTKLLNYCEHYREVLWKLKSCVVRCRNSSTDVCGAAVSPVGTQRFRQEDIALLWSWSSWKCPPDRGPGLVLELNAW